MKGGAFGESRRGLRERSSRQRFDRSVEEVGFGVGTGLGMVGSTVLVADGIVVVAEAMRSRWTENS